MLSWKVISNLSYAQTCDYCRKIANYYLVEFKKHPIFIKESNSLKVADTVFYGHMQGVSLIDVVHAPSFSEVYPIQVALRNARKTTGAPFKETDILRYEADKACPCVNNLEGIWVEPVKYWLCPFPAYYSKPILFGLSIGINADTNRAESNGSVESDPISFALMRDNNGTPDFTTLRTVALSTVLAAFNCNPLRGFLKELRETGVLSDNDYHFIGNTWCRDMAERYKQSNVAVKEVKDDTNAVVKRLMNCPNLLEEAIKTLKDSPLDYVKLHAILARLCLISHWDAGKVEYSDDGVRIPYALKKSVKSLAYINISFKGTPRLEVYVGDMLVKTEKFQSRKEIAALFKWINKDVSTKSGSSEYGATRNNLVDVYCCYAASDIGLANPKDAFAKIRLECPALFRILDYMRTYTFGSDVFEGLLAWTMSTKHYVNARALNLHFGAGTVTPAMRDSIVEEAKMLMRCFLLSLDGVKAKIKEGTTVVRDSYHKEGSSYYGYARTVADIYYNIKPYKNTGLKLEFKSVFAHDVLANGTKAADIKNVPSAPDIIVHVVITMPDVCRPFADIEIMKDSSPDFVPQNFLYSTAGYNPSAPLDYWASYLLAQGSTAYARFGYFAQLIISLGDLLNVICNGKSSRGGLGYLAPVCDILPK